MPHIRNLCPYKNKVGCADCRFVEKTIQLYGNDYKNHLDWQKACSFALERAHQQQDFLDDLVSDERISEQLYINQSTRFVKRFYEDLTWHHMYMITKKEEDKYSALVKS